MLPALAKYMSLNLASGGAILLCKLILQLTDKMLEHIVI